MGRRPGSLNRKTRDRIAAQAGGLPLAAGESLDASSDSTGHPVPTKLPASVDIAAPRAGDVVTFLEYKAPAGDTWRIEDREGWGSDFGVTAAEAAPWHDAMASHGELWELLRRRYGIAPLSGSDPDFMTALSVRQLAEQRGQSAEEVARRINAGREYWGRWKMSRRDVDLVASEEPEGMSNQEIERLLRKYHLSHLKNPVDRAYAAKRVVDMSGKLEDDTGAPIALNAIKFEVEMAGLDRTIAKGTAEMESAETWGGGASLRDELAKLRDERRRINGEYLTTMKAIEGTHAQNAGVKKRNEFRACLGDLVEAVRLYEERGDRRLIDGVHTAGEIQILTEEVTLRPAQYRADMVAIVEHAFQRWNIFNEDYQPPSMPRTMWRRFCAVMRAGWRAMASEAGGVPDLETGAMAALGDATQEEVGDVESLTPEPLPMSSTGIAAAATLITALHTAGARVDSRRGEEFAG